jgi:diguanylate cyclase (GGDEF)-like protein
MPDMGELTMNAVSRATLVAIAGVVASIVIALIVLPLLGSSFGPAALVMCVACPLLIGFPVSLRTFRQSEQLRLVNEALRKAHGELARAHAELAEKARLDPMTGMLNREAFFASIRDARVEPAAGALLIIDADHFKRINDEHGHMTGDAALLRIAAAIRSGARPNDILGRIGGEEFGVFMPAVGDLEATVVAEQIRRAVEGITFRLAPGRELALSVSIGGMPAPRSAALTDLMRSADRALYEAKRRGRNRVVFDEELAAVA